MQSPDARFLLNLDEESGVSLAACAADTKVVPLTQDFSWDDWSADGRFLLLRTLAETAIEVFDSERDFQSVFESPCTQTRWSPQGSKLFLACESEAGEDLEISEVDVAAPPVEETSRGTLAAADLQAWEILPDGTMYLERPESEALKSAWVLSRNTNDWRRIASGLDSAALSFFSPDGNFVLYREERLDGTHAFSAVPLHAESPLAIPLLPVPAPSLDFVEFYAGGVLLAHLADIDFPFEGQVWWSRISESNFGPPLPVADVSFAAYVKLQPQP
jgi:hypothetical protein